MSHVFVLNNHDINRISSDTLPFLVLGNRNRQRKFRCAFINISWHQFFADSLKIFKDK